MERGSLLRGGRRFTAWHRGIKIHALFIFAMIQSRNLHMRTKRNERKSGMIVRACMLCAIALGSASLLAEQPTQLQHAPKTVVNSVLCLLHAGEFGPWVNSAGKETLTIGYVVDRKIYSGQNHLFIAVFDDGRSGSLFDIQTAKRKAKQVFKIENNGSFRIQGNKIEFTDAPLGGVWTQEQLEAHLRVIQNRRKIVLFIRDLLQTSPDVACTSYAEDSQ
jgi:hypothetical protein